MKKISKKGFTLVELLAVIVILAIVMLIAVSSIGPIMAKTEKGAIVDEGLSLIRAGELAYQTERLNSSSTIVKKNQSACLNIKWLYQNGYYKKGSDSDGYIGSVLVDYDSSTDTYSYKFWLSDGTYTIGRNDDGKSNPGTSDTSMV